MTTDSKALAIIPRTVDEVRSLAVVLAKSALLPVDLRGRESDVLMQIMTGQELGLPPIAALRGIHIIKGKPVLAADTMVGIVLSSGLAEFFLCTEDTAERVTYQTKRRGAPSVSTCSYSMEDAKRAGLVGGDNWRRHPRAMLKARCKAMLARDVYPDVLSGCYETDEAREFSDGADLAPISPITASNAIEAEFHDAPAPKAAAPVEPRRTIVDDDSDLDVIEKTKTIAELMDLVDFMRRMPDAKKERARVRWEAQRSHLHQVAADEKRAS